MNKILKEFNDSKSIVQNNFARIINQNI